MAVTVIITTTGIAIAIIIDMIDTHLHGTVRSEIQSLVQEIVTH